MDALTFLRRGLPDEGYYCLFAAKASEEFPIQKFYDTVGEVIDHANRLDALGWDTYYAVATYEDAKSRKVENIKYNRSLFLDLDCGAGKPYKTKNDALLALRGFCKTLSLPKPLLIDSGRGIHVYWILTESVSYDEWYPVALRLKAACKDKELHADHAITADAARILRIPDTHNHKDTPPARVFVLGVETPPPVQLDNFAEHLGTAPVAIPKKKSKAAIDDPVMRALLGNRRTYYSEIMRKTSAGKGCAQILRVYEDPDSVSEPTWRDAISIIKHCDDTSVKHAHNMSRGYADYDPDETDLKYQRAQYVHLCKTFDEHSPDICPNCPHWGKIKTPIVLGTKTLEAETSQGTVVEFSAAGATTPVPLNIPTYPKPYFRGLNGGIYLRTKDAEGETEEKVIYHNDLYVVRRIIDPTMGESIVTRLHLPQDGVREFVMPLTSVTSRDELRKELSKQGIVPRKMEDVMTYINAWVHELQAKCKADEARTQFGWVGDDFKCFILGNRQIYADRVDYNPPSSQTAALFKAFDPKGTLEGWKETLDFYNRTNMELHQYVVGTSFGAPLMSLTPINCAILHLHSKDTGFGKTTAMMAAASLWGHHKQLILDDGDTAFSKLNRAEVYKNLPLYLDEVTETLPRDLSAMVYALPTGRQRNRMSSGTNEERHRGEPWKFLAVTTGNTSIIERINSYKAMPKAEMARVIECRVDQFKSFTGKTETDTFSLTVENGDHRGVASVEYLQYVMQNIDLVRQMWHTIQKRLDNQAGLTAQNRFWSVAASATLTGLIIAKQLGLINYDLKALEQWIVALLVENIHQAAAMAQPAMATISDYIYENYGNILKVPSTFDRRSKDGVVALAGLNHDSDRQNKIVGRYEPDTQMAYFVPKPLRKWCTDKQINYNQLVDELVKEYGGRRMKTRITKGTSISMPPTQVIRVNCDPTFFKTAAQGSQDPEDLDLSDAKPETEETQVTAS